MYQGSTKCRETKRALNNSSMSGAKPSITRIYPTTSTTHPVVPTVYGGKSTRNIYACLHISVAVSRSQNRFIHTWALANLSVIVGESNLSHG